MLKYYLIVNSGFKYRNYELRKHLKWYLLGKIDFLIFLGFVVKMIIKIWMSFEASELLKHIFSVLLHNVILISANIVEIWRKFRDFWIIFNFTFYFIFFLFSSWCEALFLNGRTGRPKNLKTHNVDKEVFHYGVSKEMRRWWKSASHPSLLTGL